MKLTSLLLVFLMSNAFAQEMGLTTYVKMQEALANDDFKTALEHHKVICIKELAKHSKEYKDCNKKFKDIDGLRESFKTLSVIYMTHGNKSDMKGLMKASCPMANAKWIQKEGSLKNPYYGKSMLECGEKI